MSLIRPISDLRNHADQISDLCHEHREPVFITKNGKGDLVVMSQTFFEQQQALLELYQKLNQAEQEAQSLQGSVSHKEMMARLQSKKT